jgi:hypothetical protein
LSRNPKTREEGDVIDPPQKFINFCFRTEILAIIFRIHRSAFQGEVGNAVERIIPQFLRPEIDRSDGLKRVAQIFRREYCQEGCCRPVLSIAGESCREWTRD